MKLPTVILQLSLSIFVFFIVVSAEILPGSILSASIPNQTWVSPNNLFSFGFIAEGPIYFASIIYSGIPIWKAGGNVGGATDSSASLHFTSDGDLRLLNGSGSILWQSNTGGGSVSSASLDNSGNFVLKNGNLSIWSTFDNPTDTIVPSQNFRVNQTLRSGLYSFALPSSGELTLKWNDSIVYYNMSLNASINTNLTSPSLGLQSIGILSLSDPTLSSPVVMAYTSDYAEGNDLLRFMRLDSDGNLRIYSSSRGSGTSIVRWSAVSDQCRVFGYCGDMGICRYQNANPICGCPSENFEPIDLKDSKKGCKRKVGIEDCPETATMLPLDHAQFLIYPPELSSQVYTLGIIACRSNCLVSKSCVASTTLSDGTGTCYLIVSGLVSGYQSPALPSTSYLKVCGPLQPTPSVSSLGASEDNFLRLQAWMLPVVIVGAIWGFILLECGLWWWCCRNRPKFRGLPAQYALLEYASGAPVRFSYKELQRSTKLFKEKLGAGGFGAVYRGVLANKTVVAVKQLEGIEHGEKQFRMGVVTISSTHHLNLVRLIGFCSEGCHRLLVYEFMKNGSLDNFLFTTEAQLASFLNWECRFKIALGTARGITYLHEECRDCIVHCDIKPENILLDENHNAKVLDFGLAKLMDPKDHRHRSLTSVRGIRGYLAPELLEDLPITSKSDVYSYGMVLLEIVSGRRNFEVSADTNQKKCSMWAYEEYKKGNVRGILDKRLNGEEVDLEQVMRAIQLSFWCIQEQPSQRPMMGKVVQMLEGIMEIERPPAPKAVTMGSLGGTGVNMSKRVSALSTFGASATASSSLSFQTTGVSFSVSGRNLEKASSSLLQSM